MLLCAGHELDGDGPDDSPENVVLHSTLRVLDHVSSTEYARFCAKWALIEGGWHAWDTLVDTAGFHPDQATRACLP